MEAKQFKKIAIQWLTTGTLSVFTSVAIILFFGGASEDITVEAYLWLKMVSIAALVVAVAGWRVCKTSRLLPNELEDYIKWCSNEE
ncbi:MAG: hypothetical protein MSG77_07650 [Prevotella sp.]|nr:hypothetical protein [Prevotella sp.]